MTYKELRHFLLDKMRMSHIYQPVMIKCLLRNNGVADDVQIAKEISLHDPSQIEYYREITNNMVGKVLASHHIVTKEKKEYKINGFEELKKTEIKDLIDLCNEKLEGYIAKRGADIWLHRGNNRELISGSIKYEVLKRAHFRCELCGCLDSERALQVDHIVPKNHGGEDSINNYQALCYSCNAMKRDTDSTDFRENDVAYGRRAESCIFCTMEPKRIVTENNLAYVVYDLYPVTDLHMLIIPKRHFPDYFDIYQPEVNAMQQLLLQGKEIAKKKDISIKGFNIGINCGAVAGQTINHCHTHLIPRRENDTDNSKEKMGYIL